MNDSPLLIYNGEVFCVSDLIEKSYDLGKERGNNT
ncbi:hypothetical protein AJ85_14305 [Alkalihalobacillus alcalophilus ATCC 27647 = CGMCC 1.3604]|uniref:Uncharacterized protein n=1 Tax=Alkalihalobacillus alcalophilus ATCC 27647 = CGMCC 1.3604 TaxID=1218173 RepID=A0A4S4JXN6_ALKAL|nr:hypothetical protein AJ85_14305 [Alkalihalobacillus alcalophilus ATCC 27647 = CGMCC 1.3604]